MSKHGAIKESSSGPVSAVAEAKEPNASIEASSYRRGQIGRSALGGTASAAAVRSPVVLVVEEGPLALIMLNAALVDANFDVISVQSVADALTQLRSGATRPDAMLINMGGAGPDCAQVRLASLARRRWPKLVVLATSTDTDPVVSGMPDGTQTMAEPVVLEDLVANLRTLLAPRGNIGLHGQPVGSSLRH